MELFSAAQGQANHACRRRSLLHSPTCSDLGRETVCRRLRAPGEFLGVQIILLRLAVIHTGLNRFVAVVNHGIRQTARIVYNHTKHGVFEYEQVRRSWLHNLVVNPAIILRDAQGPIPETIRSLWKSDRITNFSSAHNFSIRSDSTNDPASIGSWSWRSCSLLGSVLDQKFHHNNWSFYQ